MEKTEQTEMKMWTILKRQMELKTMVLVTVEININVDVQAAYCSPVQKFRPFKTVQQKNVMAGRVDGKANIAVGQDNSRRQT